MRHHWIWIILAAVAIPSFAHAQEGEGGGGGEENKLSIIARPKGDIVVCTVTCTGAVVIVLDNGDRLQSQSSADGSATLESQGPVYTEQEQVQIAAGVVTEDELPARTAYAMQSITLTGVEENLGAEFSFTLDPDRPAPLSLIKANQADADFPATADVYANVTGTVGGLPGTFTNTTTCHMRTTNLTTFLPQVNEPYEFVEDVVFSNEQGTTFTIPAGASVTLN